FLLVYGPRLWPAAFVAAFASEIVVSVNEIAVIPTIASCLWISVVYGALAAILRRLDLARPLENARDAGRMAVASVIASCFAGLGFVGIFLGAGELSSDEALQGLPRYCFADLNGILMLTPLLVLMGDLRESLSVLRRQWREAAVQGASVLATLI